MTQEAVVTKVFENGMAEVAVARGTACGSNCGNCEACKYQTEIKSIARNVINASKGQHVLIESKSTVIFKAVALVYVMPLILFLLGYSAAYICGVGEGGCIAASFAGLVIGAGIIVYSQRRKNHKSEISFDIVELLN